MGRTMKICVRAGLLGLVAAVAGAAFAEPGSAAPVTGQRTALVIVVGWAEGNGTPPSTPDKQPAEIESQSQTHINPWYQAVSHGVFQGWSFQARGPFTIPTPNENLDPSARCDLAWLEGIAQGANAKAAQQGVDPAQFTNVVYYFAKEYACPWQGISDGNRIWLNGVTSRTLVHELGHTLTLGHANALRCTNASGALVSLSNTCTKLGYVDQYSVMSDSGTGSFTAVQLAQLGWNGSGRQQDAPVDLTTPFRVTLRPLSDTGPGLQVLRVVDGTAPLWIEYRQPAGVDSPTYFPWAGGVPPVVRGVLLHQQLSSGLESLLLDMTPGDTNAFYDARLPVGQTWTNPQSNTRITVESADATGARIRLDRPFPATAKVPNLIGGTRTDAANQLSLAGLKLGTVTLVTDPSCDYIDLVTWQSPAAGTTVAGGSPVAVRIGKAPTSCHL